MPVWTAMSTVASFFCEAWLHTGRPAFDQAAWAAGLLTEAHGSDADTGGRMRRHRRRPSPARRGFTPTDWPSTRQRGLPGVIVACGTHAYTHGRLRRQRRRPLLRRGSATTVGRLRLVNTTCWSSQRRHPALGRLRQRWHLFFRAAALR